MRATFVFCLSGYQKFEKLKFYIFLVHFFAETIIMPSIYPNYYLDELVKIVIY